MAIDNIFRLELSNTQAQPQAVNAAPVTAPYTEPATTEMELPGEAYHQPSGLVITEMIATPAGSDQRRLLLIGVGLILTSLALGLFLYSDDSADPIGTIMAMFGIEPEAPAISFPTPKKPSDVVAVSAPKTPENPYWELPNQTLGQANHSTRQWTNTEELMWRNAMAHRFSYQHFKTVSDIRTYKLKGSEVILWEALKEKKFWTRMIAVFGLADMGVAVDIEQVEKAIGNTRPSLINNYFKRFAAKQTEGELYILRQALRLVEADARLTILKALVSRNEQITHLYLVAATFDPGRGIKPFAEGMLAQFKVPADIIEAYRKYIMGAGTLPADFTAAAEKAAQTQNAPVRAEKVSASEFVSKVEYFKGSAETDFSDSDKPLDVIEIK